MKEWRNFCLANLTHEIAITIHQVTTLMGDFIRKKVLNKKKLWLIKSTYNKIFVLDPVPLTKYYRQPTLHDLCL